MLVFGSFEEVCQCVVFVAVMEQLRHLDGNLVDVTVVFLADFKALIHDFVVHISLFVVEAWSAIIVHIVEEVIVWVEIDATIKHQPHEESAYIMWCVDLKISCLYFHVTC